MQVKSLDNGIKKPHNNGKSSSCDWTVEMNGAEGENAYSVDVDPVALAET